jgi:hypothetical protein
MADPDPLTPQQRSLRARLAAYSMHAQHDSKETTRSARAAFDERFYREVDPDNLLPIEERERRADYARRAHFTKLSFESSRLRRQRRAAKKPRRRDGMSTDG